MRRTIVALSASVGLTAYVTYRLEKHKSLCKANATNADSSNQPYEWNNNWDDKHHLYDHKKRLGTHYIVLVRHGQYEERQELDENRKLTDIGRKQAVMTGKRLDELLSRGVLPPVKTLYYSTMTRATETGKLILSQLPPSTASEACALIQEGAVARPNPSAGPGWAPSDEEFEKEGARVEEAFKKHFYRITPDAASLGQSKSPSSQSHTTVLVCHGNVIRYLSLRALQLPTFAWLRLAVYNGSITVLEIRPSGHVSIRNLGDVGHLPPELITYSLRN